jgi:hypothetical protein
MQTRSVGFDLFLGHMEEQTERERNMMNLIATYHNF